MSPEEHLARIRMILKDPGRTESMDSVLDTLGMIEMEVQADEPQRSSTA